MVPVVTRTEYLLTDINEDDVNENGSIVTLMNDAGDQREDLRLPDGEAYANLRAAFAKGEKEVWITVINAMDINMIDPQCVCPPRAGASSTLHGPGVAASAETAPLGLPCSFCLAPVPPTSHHFILRCAPPHASPAPF